MQLHASDIESRDLLQRLVQELRDTQQSLRFAEARFRVLAQRGPVAILEADVEGRCVYANETWCGLTGLSLAETLGFAWSRSVHPDDAAVVMEQWLASIASGECYLNEVRLIRPDGSVVHVLAAAHPIVDATGATVGYIGSAADITGIKRTLLELADKERILRQLIDVQENERRTLCHEFHDGLIQYAVGAKMMLEGWLQRHPDGPEAAMIETAVRSLGAGLVEGRRTIRGIRPALLDDLGLEAAIADLLDVIAADGVTIDRRIDPALGTMPAAVQTTIYRVVQEALLNARRHSGSNRVVVALSRCGDDIQLAVEDFGCGFDVDLARARGCGLIGMLERVRLAGGECRIESRPRAGTRISVRLRVPPADVADSAAAPDVRYHP